MNPLLQPPMREAIGSPRAIQADPVFISAAWMMWFSDIERLFNEMQATGTTAERPAPPPFIGFQFFDTTLGKPIWALSETQWVDATGAVV